MFDKEKRLKKQIDRLVGEYDKHFVKARTAHAAKKYDDAKLHEMRMEGVSARIRAKRAELKRLQGKNK